MLTLPFSGRTLRRIHWYIECNLCYLCKLNVKVVYLAESGTLAMETRVRPSEQTGHIFQNVMFLKFATKTWVNVRAFTYTHPDANQGFPTYIRHLHRWSALAWQPSSHTLNIYQQFHCCKTWLSHFRRARRFVFDYTRGLYQTAVNCI